MQFRDSKTYPQNLWIKKVIHVLLVLPFTYFWYYLYVLLVLPLYIDTSTTSTLQVQSTKNGDNFYGVGSKRNDKFLTLFFRFFSQNPAKQGEPRIC